MHIWIHSTSARFWRETRPADKRSQRQAAAERCRTVCSSESVNLWTFKKQPDKQVMLLVNKQGFIHFKLNSSTTANLLKERTMGPMSNQNDGTGYESPSWRSEDSCGLQSFDFLECLSPFMFSWKKKSWTEIKQKLISWYDSGFGSMNQMNEGSIWPHSIRQDFAVVEDLFWRIVWWQPV